MSDPGEPGYEGSVWEYIDAIIANRAERAMTNPINTPPSVSIEKALRRAYTLGQAYSAQADSDSYTQNAKAMVTRQEFDTLVADTLRALPSLAELERDALDRIIRAYDHHQSNMAEGLGAISGAKLREAIDAARAREEKR